ncbi:hypothetical protein [Nonomuraea sp. NEAU-A123]|uniref:hypothetical protein n=1 Tax=Nonomuraea sp. NEAU-A123 TaxID=2839649 RepID=UPI001BE46732|nr:hypothetical protein [Nonomuraea sp. NEAU-A123]MBT2230835.1 hypothetical protein [Nonomuraea sp. NEAU-A123]
MATDEATAQIKGWFTGRLPEGWFTGAPEIVRDREEIAVLGTLPEPDFEGSDTEKAALIEGLIGRFREETRERRIEIAKEAERRFGQKISWGIVCGDATVMFTTLSVPVMTRLRQQERQVLDTLVAAGVARSRSDALAWCVRLVGKNTDTWLSELRDALQHVDRVRSAGPDVNS